MTGATNEKLLGSISNTHFYSNYAENYLTTEHTIIISKAMFVQILQHIFR